MTERAKQFLAQLEQTDRKFVHIEVAVIREVIAEVRRQALEDCVQVALTDQEVVPTAMSDLTEATSRASINTIVRRIRALLVQS